MISVKNCKYGMMAFNTNDFFVGRSLQEYGEFSEGESDLFRSVIKLGMTVCDVGANIGAHTVLFSKLVGPTGNVLAFEPQRLCYYNLCTNITLNNITNVICIQNAVGSENGRIHVPELDFSKPNNFGGLNLKENHLNQHGHSVKMVRIDDFNLPSCHFIKADVETMEVDVIQGALKTIENFNPLLYLESDKKQQTTTLIRLLNNIGYKTYVHAPPLFNRNNFLKNTSNHFQNLCSVNIFCHHNSVDLEFDPATFNMTEIGKNRTFIIAGTTPEEAKKTIEETKEAVIKGLCSMADNCSDNLHDPKQAMQYLNHAIMLNPDDWTLYNKALPILAGHLQYEEALKYADISLDKGGDINVVMNRGIIFAALDNHKAAIEDFRQVLEYFPYDADAHFNLGIELLKIGQFQEGWEEYEWRFKKNNPALIEFMGFLPHVDTWDGSPLNGRKILLYTEQGAGDLIQFSRYAKMVKDSGGYVVLACFPALEKVCKNIKGVDEIVVHGPNICLDNNFQCDLKCSLMSLPRLFKTKLESIPFSNGDGYIREVNNDKFDDVLKSKKFKIGICWAGSETHPFDHCRSTYLKYFSVLQKQGVELYSLQKGRSDRTWNRCGKVELKENCDINLIDLTDRIEDFNDTANLIRNLDLIITVDTSVAHLAGSMGKPVWTLLWKNIDWRWMDNKDYTPWYPSMKLFRGTNWEDVFCKVEICLNDLLKDIGTNGISS